MSKKELFGNVSTATFPISDGFAGLNLHGVSVGATIKVAYNSNRGDGEQTTIQTIKTGILMEAVDKILWNEIKQNSIRRVVEVDNHDDSATVMVLQNAILPIGSGQLELDDDEKVTVLLKELSKVKEASYVSTSELHTPSKNVLRIIKNTMSSDKDKKQVVIDGAKYLILPATGLPEALEITKNGNNIKFSIEDILTLQEELYGLVRKDYMKNGDVVDYYGVKDCVLIPLHGVTKCVIHDEVSQNNYDYFTVKI